jgi:hypothetical protein
MLVQLLVFVIVAGLIWYLVMLLPLPAPFRTIAQVIMILIAISFLLSLVGWWPGGPLHWR